jgi:hypothetical protein
MRLSVFILALLAPPLAEGAWPRYCESAASLQRKVVNCEANYLALHSSDLCVQGLNREIELAQKNLSAAMSEIGASDRSGQRGDFENSRQNLAATLTTFRALVATALAVRAEVARYPHLIAFPGGISRRRAAARGQIGMLSSFECYKDPLLVLKSDLVSLDQKISELRKGEAASATLAGRTSQQIVKLGAAESAGPAGRRLVDKEGGKEVSTISGNLKAERRASDPRASTITARTDEAPTVVGTKGPGGDESIAEAQRSLLRALSSRGTGARAKLNESGSAGEAFEAEAETLVQLGAESGSSSASSPGEAGLNHDSSPAFAGAGIEASSHIRALGSLEVSMDEAARQPASAEESTLFQRTHAAYERILRRGRLYGP